MCKQSKFYKFHQNNSGGKFVVNEYLAEWVYIQAKSADEANEIAEDKGIYFDGVSSGRDCPCCGDRWWPVDEDETDMFQGDFGSLVIKIQNEPYPFTDPIAIIHRAKWTAKVRGSAHKDQ
jgi:hypothetical protein